jgi:CBS domain-containing protein
MTHPEEERAMQVEHILQSKGSEVVTVSARARIAEAIQVLNGRRIGAVVVVEDDGQVDGILSERDIVRRMGDDPTTFLQTLVGDCMTRKVVTCARLDTIAGVMETMTRNRIRHLPVVEGGRLVGLVSIGDVVKGRIEEAEQEALALREYIAS